MESHLGGAGTKGDPIFLDDVPEHGQATSGAVRQDAILISSDEEDNMDINASGQPRDGSLRKKSGHPQNVSEGSNSGRLYPPKKETSKERRERRNRAKYRKLRRESKTNNSSQANSSTQHMATDAKDLGLQSSTNEQLANHDQKPMPHPLGSKSPQGRAALSTSRRKEAHVKSNDDMPIPTLHGLSDVVGHRTSPMRPFNHERFFSNTSRDPKETHERETSHASMKTNSIVLDRTRAHDVPVSDSPRSKKNVNPNEENAPTRQKSAPNQLPAARDNHYEDLSTGQPSKDDENSRSFFNVAALQGPDFLSTTKPSSSDPLGIAGAARSNDIGSAAIGNSPSDRRIQGPLASPISTTGRGMQRARKSAPISEVSASSKKSRTEKEERRQQRKRDQAERLAAIDAKDAKDANSAPVHHLHNDVQPGEGPVPPQPTSASPAIMPSSSTLPTAPQIELDESRSAREIHLAVNPLSHDDPKHAITTRKDVESCLKDLLRIAHENHEYMTSALLRQQRMCRERERRARNYARDGPTLPALPEKYIQHDSPFKNLKSIQTRVQKGSQHHGLRDFSEDVEPKASSKAKKGKRENHNKAYFTVPMFKYKSDAVTVPPFTEFVHLKQTLLGENHSKLLLVASDMADEGLDDLVNTYELMFDNKPYLDLRKEQMRFYQHTLTEFLNRLSIPVDIITYWFLRPKLELNQFPSPTVQARSLVKMFKERSEYEFETLIHDNERKKVRLFDRSLKKWHDLMKSLERRGVYSQDNLTAAALACEMVFKECGFSLWYLAIQSESVRELHERQIVLPTRPAASHIKDLRCRVCHQHKCIAHGELRQEPTSDSDEEPAEEPAHWHTDRHLEKIINYRVPANSSSNAYNKPPPPDPDPVEKLVKWEKYEPFIPCSHEGSCSSAACRCFLEEVNCEKACKCAMSCSNRFPGCACRKGPNKRPCEMNSNCLCAKNNRECDPDLCQKCEAGEILDRVNRFNDEILLECCANVPVQRGLPRKTLIGKSEVHGFGLFSGEDFKKNDYVGEYVGEQISGQEADRRATRDGYKATQYAFDVNRSQTSDSSYMGNNFRFINNASDGGANLYTKSILCNTVLRIAFYAKYDIKAGTELFFNYNYDKEHMKEFTEPKAQKAIAVKQSKKGKGVKKGKRTGDQMLHQLGIDESARSTRTQKSAREFQSQSTSQSTQESKSSVVLPPDDDEDDEDFVPGDGPMDQDADDESETGSANSAPNSASNSASNRDSTPPRRNMRRERARQRVQNKPAESRKSRNKKRGFADSDEE